jgi:hypothetical protein
MVLGSNCRIRVWGGHKIAGFVRGVISRGSDMDFDYLVITIHNLSLCVSNVFLTPHYLLKKTLPSLHNLLVVVAALLTCHFQIHPYCILDIPT